MTDTDSKFILRAKFFAEAGHDSIGQTRKYTGEPYHVHIHEVGNIVMSVTNDVETIAAAFLHDLEEDVKGRYGLSYIHLRFGLEVRNLVEELTDKYTPEHYPYLNRAERKVLEAWRISQTSSKAQTIKVADLISNTRSIVDYDVGFARTYLLEKERMLAGLTKANPILLERAKQILTEAKEKVNI